MASSLLPTRTLAALAGIQELVGVQHVFGRSLAIQQEGLIGSGVLATFGVGHGERSVPLAGVLESPWEPRACSPALNGPERGDSAESGPLKRLSSATVLRSVGSALSVVGMPRCAVAVCAICKAVVVLGWPLAPPALAPSRL